MQVISQRQCMAASLFRKAPSFSILQRQATVTAFTLRFWSAITINYCIKYNRSIVQKKALLNRTVTEDLCNLFLVILAAAGIFGRQTEAIQHNNNGGNQGAVTCLAPATDSNIILGILNGGIADESLPSQCYQNYLPGVGGRLLLTILPQAPRPRKRPAPPKASRHPKVISPAFPWDLNLTAPVGCATSFALGLPRFDHRVQ